MKKAMSAKQRKAIEGVEYALGIKYEGEATVQGAFLFLNKHINKAQKEINRRIKEEYREVTLLQMAESSLIFTDNQIIDQMNFYRFDNAEHQLGDEDETYAETPTLESLRDDTVRWSMFI